MVNASSIATRGDIARLEKQMAEMEARMTKAMYNAFFGFAGVTIAIVAVAILK